jgi:hypothetical protein
MKTCGKCGNNLLIAYPKYPEGTWWWCCLCAKEASQ